ncbi:hypothetical protein [Snodgrassella sp. CFCC 13594]|uniref:hypothetical protein n=1 Tax=Snodgrassella sp. CFCC 13594 TaxID=1775559 RepID=UPI0008332EA2|nr:hypothetical protein [Snodgrassella sp. CFCC 13594]
MGKANRAQKNTSGFLVKYFADDIKNVTQLGLIPAHTKALNYLSKILFPDDDIPQNNRSLMVVWIGVDAKHGYAGGAAGDKSFIANYLVSSNKLIEHKNRAQTLMILSREQFHQLVEIKRHGLNSLPSWVNESLAQYYGLRSLAEALPNDQQAQELVKLFIRPAKIITHSMPEVEKLFSSDRPNALDLSYNQGATIWFELDKALRSNKNNSNLETFLPALLRMDFPDNGKLPDEFISEMKDQENQYVDKVLLKYIGN